MFTVTAMVWPVDTGIGVAKVAEVKGAGMGNSSPGHEKVLGLGKLLVTVPPPMQGLRTVATDETLVVVAAIAVPLSTS